LKFTYTFGLPIAAAAGVVAAELFHFIKGRTAFEKKTILVALLFMCFIGVAASTLFVQDKVPNIEFPNPDWKAALKWMREETPEDAKIFNWWDYGHWISFIGERAVLTDNRNIYYEPLQDVAKFIITLDVKEGARIVKSYDSDYVILSQDVFQKEASYARYAFDTVNIDDANIIPYRIGPTFSVPCESREQEGQLIYVCGNAVFTEEQASTIPTEWTTKSNQLYENKVRMFIYIDKDRGYLYQLNPTVNESMAAKLWFHYPEAMKYFEEVYGAKGIKIFRVKKDAISNV